MTQEGRVVIVGSGLAGTLLACYLARQGRAVTLYERRSDPRSHEAERGRSINLALSVRGIHALREVDLADAVLAESVLMRGRMIHHRDGSLAFQPYGKDDSEALHSVSRAGLNRLLVEVAGRLPGVEQHFDHRCTSFDPRDNELEFTTPGEEVVRVRPDFVIGADGAWSAVRAGLQKTERFDYHQEFLSHGYKELSIPPGPGDGFQIEKHALHIWPRGSFMMIALPNLDGSFTCTLFWPFEGPNSFAALHTPEDIVGFFEQEFPDAVPLLPDLPGQFLGNPTSPLVTIRCHPWYLADRVALLGDACHAVVPFLGQGMNAAFEDCTVLAACLAEHPHDQALALQIYEGRRREHTDTLAQLCVENFLEMRDRVGSRWFILRKKLTLLLHALFPRWYLPLYTMVEFTRIPYARAVERAVRQDRVVAGIGAGLLAGLLAVGIGVLGWLAR
jgi:kynurenine 3-monooxygenase